MTADPLLTPEEVASRLAVTVETVRGWLVSGELRGRKLGRSRLWRIEPAAVEAFAPVAGQEPAPGRRRRTRPTAARVADAERDLAAMGVL